MPAIHPVAARGFAKAAEAYERGRPAAPPEAVAVLLGGLGVGPGSTLLELGAGTGKLTRSLVPSGARIIAVEPVAEMRRLLVRAAPSAEVVDATAEAIPIPDGSVDAVVCAQSFHWFRADEALREIHRVLRDGGTLGLLWNVRDDRDPLSARITRLLAPYRRGIPGYRDGAWRERLDAFDGFEPPRIHRLDWTERQAPEDLLARVMSVSAIAALPDGERARVEDEVRALVAATPRDAEGRVAIPYVTEIYLSRRRGRR